MKIEFWMHGKTADRYLAEGIKIYVDRINHYVPFKMAIIDEVRKSGTGSSARLRQQQGQKLLNRLQPGDFLILLDQRGKSLSSVEFAGYLENQLVQSHRRLIFCAGGAYGFSESVYARCNFKLSLSAMTFSHQMVRLFFVEQFYRALTILRGEKYHNE